jgi:PAS domain-containing protein
MGMKRILVVGDDSSLERVRIPEHERESVDLVGSIAEAAERQAAQQYDKVLVDPSVLSVSGYEFIADQQNVLGDRQICQDRWRVMADSPYGWEYWLDPSGRIVYMSPSCERVTGHPPEAFIKDPSLLEQVIHPEDLHMFADHAH